MATHGKLIYKITIQFSFLTICIMKKIPFCNILMILNENKIYLDSKSVVIIDTYLILIGLYKINIVNIVDL